MNDKSLVQKFVGDERNDKSFALFQVPNLPLIVGLVCYGLNMLLANGKLDTLFGIVGFGAIFTWAWLELFKGVNWARRALGLAVLILITVHRSM